MAMIWQAKGVPWIGIRLSKAGGLLNLKLSSTKENIARAFLEALVFEIADCYRRIERMVGRPEVIQVS